MNRVHTFAFSRAAAIILVGSLASAALAQPSIIWSTIDNGGSVSTAPLSGGTISIRGTIGQHDAAASTHTGIGVMGGYWGSALIPGACPADLDDGTGTGTPDGGITIDDLLYFLIAFENGSINADLDDGSGTNTPDGGVTIDDLLYFLVRFENGC